jgi:hypothetical protein
MKHGFHSFSMAVTTLALAAMITGCGSNAFNGGSDNAPPSPRGANSTTGNPNGTTGTSIGGTTGSSIGGTIGGLNPSDSAALRACLAKWGSHPFGDINNLPVVRKIDAAVSVFGIGSKVRDDQYTPNPVLVVVDAAVNVLGATTYEFLNPNGWYCLKVGVNVASQTTVHLKQQAHIADSQLNVNVGSGGTGAGAVGVNVGSNVNVIRVN